MHPVTIFKAYKALFFPLAFVATKYAYFVDRYLHTNVVYFPRKTSEYLFPSCLSFLLFSFFSPFFLKLCFKILFCIFPACKSFGKENWHLDQYNYRHIFKDKKNWFLSQKTKQEIINLFSLLKFYFWKWFLLRKTYKPKYLKTSYFRSLF